MTSLAIVIQLSQQVNKQTVAIESNSLFLNLILVLFYLSYKIHSKIFIILIMKKSFLIINMIKKPLLFNFMKLLLK